MDDLVDGYGREDDGDGVWFSALGADGTPERADVRCGPGTVRHDHVYGASDAAI